MKKTTTTTESTMEDSTKAAKTQTVKNTVTKKTVTRKTATRKSSTKKTEDNTTDDATKKTAKQTLANKTQKRTSKTTKAKEESKAPEANTLPLTDTPSESSLKKDNIKTETETNDTKVVVNSISTTTEGNTPVTYNTEKEAKVKQEQKLPTLPQIEIHNIIELSQAPQRSIILTDQQIQQLTLEDIEKRHSFLQKTLANILDYDVVISDTNIWLELLVGHTSSHSDPRINARLQFERQLEFISKLTKYRGGHFIIMSETYEEIDRFACMQDPTNHREADFTDNIVCLNAAARLAKRLILSQQRENRLRINNIGAESHHASFADPAIIKCVAELFASGKKVLLLTNDASVAIRSIGICDDLQRHNGITDKDWNEHYAPLRPMVFTFDDLKILDFYTRQYHYIQMASGQPWMAEISRTISRETVAPLTLWTEAFRPGDKRKSDNLFTEQEQKQIMQKQQAKQQPVKKQQTKLVPKPKTDIPESPTIKSPQIEGTTELASTEQPKTEQNNDKSSQKRKTQSTRRNTSKSTRNAKKSPSAGSKTSEKP